LVSVIVVFGQGKKSIPNLAFYQNKLLFFYKKHVANIKTAFPMLFGDQEKLVSEKATETSKAGVYTNCCLTPSKAYFYLRLPMNPR
jgi:hypothetical protein